MGCGHLSGSPWEAADEEHSKRSRRKRTRIEDLRKKEQKKSKANYTNGQKKKRVFRYIKIPLYIMLD